MFWKYFSVFSWPTLDYGEVRRNTSALYLEKGKHIESSQNGAKTLLQNCNAQHFLSFWKLASFCALVPLRCTKWIQRVSKLGLCRFSQMLPLVEEWFCTCCTIWPPHSCQITFCRVTWRGYAAQHGKLWSSTMWKMNEHPRWFTSSFAS